MSLIRTNNYDGKIAGLYDLEDTLGRGHFAVVKLARHVFTGEKVAVKVIDKTKLDEVSRAHLFQEVRCMKLVQHPNVVRLYEVIDTQTKLYLILELGDGGDMYDYIMRHEKGLDEELARKYFKQIVHAISYCHQLHVVHRDLKPENVVFFETLGMVKLTDFGFSNKYFPGQHLETSCGSLAYSAPEILLGDSYDAPAVDVWSLGVILYMLVCGHPPFQEANDSETLTMIMDCKYTIPPHVSTGCKRLIQKMLIRDPAKRSTLEQLANDPWLNAGLETEPTQYLPLVSRESVTEEEHASIVQRMVAGGIANKEEVLEALDRNAYNHITATFYLLAERKLKAQRQGVVSVIVKPATEQGSGPEERRDSVGGTSDHVTSSGPGTPPPTATITTDSLTLPAFPTRRKCSIVDEEEEEEESLDQIRTLGGPTERDLERPVRRDVTLELDLESSRDPSPSSLKIQSMSIVSPTASHRFVANKCKQVPSPQNRKLQQVRSSPQLLLNEIYEEGESDPELGPQSPQKIPSVRVLTSHQSVASSPGILKKFDQARRFSKGRTASCSSSDASDDDSDTRRRKAEKLKSFPRRDSHDDSSDSGHDPTGPGGGGGSGGNDVTRGSSGQHSSTNQGPTNRNSDNTAGGSTSGRQHQGEITRQNHCGFTRGNDTVARKNHAGITRHNHGRFSRHSDLIIPEHWEGVSPQNDLVTPEECELEIIPRHKNLVESLSSPIQLPGRDKSGSPSSTASNSPETQRHNHYNRNNDAKVKIPKSCIYKLRRDSERKENKNLLCASLSMFSLRYRDKSSVHKNSRSEPELGHMIRPSSLDINQNGLKLCIHQPPCTNHSSNLHSPTARCCGLS